MRILFFAHLKNVTGCEELTLSCGEVDADGLWRKLTPRIRDWLPIVVP